jgi:hypothetical protein
MFVIVERSANPGECVAVNLDVCVDEDEDIAARLPRAEVARSRRTEMVRPIDDDQLLGWPRCASNRSDRALQGYSPIRRRNHNRQRRHPLSLGGFVHQRLALAETV